MSRGLNFVYDYVSNASSGPVITVAGDEVSAATPDITANVPIENMNLLFQYEDFDVNTDTTLKDKIITGDADVIRNLRALRLDFTPLEQVILGIENKLTGSTTFLDDVNSTVANLTANLPSSGAGAGGSDLLNKLPAAALVSRDIGELQLTQYLTDVLNRGPTYYSRETSVEAYVAIISLFGQAAQQGMLLDNQQEIITYETYNVGFPALKVFFQANDFLDITLKYSLTNDYIYRVQTAIGGIRTGGTFTVGGQQFTIDATGRLSGLGMTPSQAQVVTYKIRFVASATNASVFNITNPGMSDRYNAALANVTKLYDATFNGSMNSHAFHINKPSGDLVRISPPSTFFSRLKDVTDNLKSEDGTATFDSLLTTYAYLSRSVFLSNNRLVPLPYLNAYVYNTPVLANIITDPSDIEGLQRAYATANTTYLTNTAMVYPLSDTNRPQLNNITPFYGSGFLTSDVNLSMFNNFIVLAATLDTLDVTKIYTFIKGGPEDRPTIRLQNSTVDYEVGKTLLLVPRTDTLDLVKTTLFNVDTVGYQVNVLQGNDPITVTSGTSLVTKFGERYNDRDGGLIMCLPSENVRFSSAFYNTTAKATLPASTYGLTVALETSTSVFTPKANLQTRVYVRKINNQLPFFSDATVVSSNTTRRWTISNANIVDTTSASITFGYYINTTVRATHRSIKWVQIPRLYSSTTDLENEVHSTEIYAHLNGSVSTASTTPLVIKFTSALGAATTVYFYGTAFRTQSVAAGATTLTINNASVGINISNAQTKNLWIVTQSGDTFTRFIVKCYTSQSAYDVAQASTG